MRSRRTFAIISHPDAGKTTLTEQLLLLGGAIQLAGTVKARKSSRYATSDWMELEKQRGISITTSVMQINYKNELVNLLDTPGHEDFSEDTYRTLTAVDSALMVIDAAKGVEDRTIKLMEVCRLRTTPIMTFINKLDREGRDPLTLLDEIEKTLSIHCIPMTWPIGTGRSFMGVYHLREDAYYLYPPFMRNRGLESKSMVLKGIDNSQFEEIAQTELNWKHVKDEISLVKELSATFKLNQFLQGQCTPVYFGSALNQFGVQLLFDDFIKYAPLPQPRATTTRIINPDEKHFSGFVFKIQANMDPNHHDRIAFLRIVSGQYTKGKRIFQVRTQKNMQISNAVVFLAGSREEAEEAYPGDIIGLHNHGTIQIGDTFTEGEQVKFIGIPNFAPELFRLVRLKDPLKSKALMKGLIQLSEEGATQVFRPIYSNDLILGAVGALQFDVVAFRLQNEYGVLCDYSSTAITHARWIKADDTKALEQFKKKYMQNLALDNTEQLVYLAPSKVNLNLVMERNPDIQFINTREHG